MALAQKALAIILAIAPVSIAWDVTYYATSRSITTGFVPDYTESGTVWPTASLTVSPIATETYVYEEYFVATENGLGRAVANVTTTHLLLPTDVSLPVVTESPTPTADPTIRTRYYAPVTISNPESCTKTEFTYTDSIGIDMPTALTHQATESEYVEFITTYVSTISTNMGGQAVTTSRCDVYFKPDVIPIVDGDIGVQYERLLAECVDPREHVCTETGQNVEATGSGGCNGEFPPTAGSGDGSPTDDAPNPSTTGGAAGLREQRAWGLVASGIAVGLALMA